MQLKCPSCKADITADNINLDRMIAKCGSCHSVFSFADRFDIENVYQPTYQKPTVERPHSMTLEKGALDLKITRKWFGPAFFFLAFFALFWNGIAWTIASAIIMSGQWFTLLFLSLHLAIGIGVLYAALTLLFNSTEIRVDHNQLHIQHGPLPVPGNRTLPVKQIAQIYCKEQVSHSRNGTTVTYEVYAIMNDHTRQKLVTGLPKSEDALYLEQEIERFLKIPDRPVQGELGDKW